ncbi:MAG: NADP-dependent glyceraldehyde-3-phosphate dehydrogenase [Spirochaetales bacterium]|nr:NADP-dependent glyceraldehyde-3-phosphate dehydrogenase [Spirochaetales bacterium]
MSIFPEKAEIPPEVMYTPIVQKEYLSGGKLISWNGPVQEVLSPVCIKEGSSVSQAVLGSYPLCTEKEALEALDAAVKAYDTGRGRWPMMRVEERIKCIQDFMFGMKEKQHEIVTMLMWEIGKTFPDATKEFTRTIAYIEDTIEAYKDLDRSCSRFTIRNDIVAQIRYAPLGVVLCMGPFNYPLNETFTTLIPALIMGNTVIFKPAKYGVLLLRPLLEAFRDSFPPGVVNTLYGDGKVIVGPVMETGKIDVLAFIGSSRVANIIEKAHPKPNRLTTVYGLEAKNPGIILPDADIGATVKECLLGALSYNGQRCTALKILFVHRSIAEEFVQKMSDGIAGLSIGMPWEDGVAITPLPEAGKTAWLKELSDDAVHHNAGIVNEGGASVNRTFFHPALLYPVNDSMKIYHEEQFGPIIPVVPFENIETPLSYIVSSNYGQQAAVFGKDPDVIARLIDTLSNQVCRININSQCQRGPDTFPFGGRKDSAEGTLSVQDALTVFSIQTLAAAKMNDLNNRIITSIVRGRRSVFLSTDFIL